jgi:hypothetical protein
MCITAPKVCIEPLFLLAKKVSPETKIIKNQIKNQIFEKELIL